MENFDHSSYKIIHKIINKSKGIYSLLKTNDGDILSGGDTDIFIYTLKEETGLYQYKASLVGHKAKIFYLYNMIYNDYILSSSKDCTIKKWNLETLQCIFTYNSHIGPVYKVITVNNNNVHINKEELIVSCSSDGTIKIWDNNDKLLNTMTGEFGGILSIVPVKKHRLISACEDKSIRLWSLTHFCVKKKYVINHVKCYFIYSLFYYEDDNKLIVGGDNCITIIDLSEFKISKRIDIEANGISSICYLLSNYYIIGLMQTKEQLLIYDENFNHKPFCLDYTHLKSISCIVSLNDCNEFITADNSNIIIWEY